MTVYQNLGAVREYDFNIWASDNSTLRLTAYELTYCNGKVTGTNTEQYVTLDVPMDTEHHDVVAFLLDGYKDWQDENWTDHDEWTGETELRRDGVPKMVTDFLDELTAYVPDEQHDFSKLDSEQDFTCRSCGIEYWNHMEQDR